VKVSIDAESTKDLPQPGASIVTAIRVPGEDGATVHLEFEPTRTFYARNLIAAPRHLFVWACKLAWLDLKGFIRGNKPRSVRTVKDALNL